MSDDLKKIYDHVYLTNPKYDEQYAVKINFILKELFYLSNNTKIIDIGCGKGHYLRALSNKGFNNLLGLELSEECCREHLNLLPHINANFIDYNILIKDKEFDLALCRDMLEHIPLDNIDSVIENIDRISNFSLLGIANHSDVFDGVELHLIQ